MSKRLTWTKIFNALIDNEPLTYQSSNRSYYCINNFDCVKKNKFMYHISMDFIGPHPSRNQLYKHGKLSRYATYEQLINQVYFEVPDTWKKDYIQLVSQYIDWYMPYQIQFNNAIENWNNINNLIDEKESKIEDYKYDITQIALLINKKYHWYSKWLLNNRKEILSNLENSLSQAIYSIENLKNNKIKAGQLVKEIQYKLEHWEKETNYIEEYEMVWETIDDFLLKCYKNEISKDIKGVYILHNTSKNKFYVGQSKDIRQRISNQHFKKGYCVNPHFSEDFNNGDKFNISIKECETKDQLDTLEKEYITKFDAFIKGYNKTGGNK